MAKANTAEAGAAADQAFEGVFDEAGEGFTFDMSSQSEDTGFPIHPPGVYTFTIDACNYKISTNSGNPMWELSLLIVGGDKGEDGEIADKKVKVRNYQVFKPEQMGRVKRFLNCIGATDIANSSAFNPKQLADDAVLVGKVGRARLKIRKSDEYGDQNEVAAFLPAGGSAGGSGDGGFQM